MLIVNDFVRIITNDTPVILISYIESAKAFALGLLDTIEKIEKSSKQNLIVSYIGHDFSNKINTSMNQEKERDEFVKRMMEKHIRELSNVNLFEDETEN